MFLSDLRRKRVSRGFREDAVFGEYSSNSTQAEPDDQLVADCCSLTHQVGDLFCSIEQAAEEQGDGQADRQTALCEADEQILDLMVRVITTAASTFHGMQSKRAVADVLLATGWHDEPSPYRDALLLSFVRDAARLRYPTAPDVDASFCGNTEATTAVITRSTICLGIIKDLAAAFAMKDHDSALEQPDTDDLDTIILALSERKEAAVESLLSVRATSASAVHAKRLVLRRMLEDGDSDADHLRVELARSYFGDLNAFIQATAREHEPSSVYSSIWSTLTSKLRWLTSAVHQR